MLSVSYMRSLPLVATHWNTIITPSDNFSISCDGQLRSAKQLIAFAGAYAGMQRTITHLELHQAVPLKPGKT